MYYKYPRTKHLPMSRSRTEDDKSHKDYSFLEGKEVIVTVKMDGENCTMYRDHIHARSISSANHPSRDWVKQFHSTIKNDIPEGWRICGENLYAKHSIEYNELSSYFYGFSIWNEKNECLSWSETLEWFNLLGIKPVGVVGHYVNNTLDFMIDRMYDARDWCDSIKQEGFVARNADSFHYDDFSKNVGKCVRENHVQTDQHWMHSEINKNKLKTE